MPNRSLLEEKVNRFAARNPLNRQHPFQLTIEEGIKISFTRIERTDGGLKQKLRIVSGPLSWLADTRLVIDDKHEWHLGVVPYEDHVRQGVICLPRGDHQWRIEITERQTQSSPSEGLTPIGNES